MKRKTKAQKGITLIALIITIVVLLILAAVAISSIQNDGILGHAIGAGDKYNNAVANEQEVLGSYMNFLNNGGLGGNSDVEYTPKGREGQTVQYDSNNNGVKEDWIIITDRDGKVEIISKNVMYDANGNGLTLGYGDTTVNVTSDLDGNRTIGDNGDKAIASYNNAITTINNFCKSIVTATDNGGVRSVGGTNNNVPAYSGSNFNAWFKGYTYVASPDTQYEKDWEKLTRLGIAGADNRYWISSRGVYNGPVAELNLGVMNVLSDSTCSSSPLWMLSLGGYVNSYSVTYGVRPVVINPAGI